MALKHKIDEKTFKALPKVIQDEYTQNGDEYVLSVEGIDDGAELKRAKAHEVAARKAAEKQVAELNEQLKTLTEERDGLLAGTVPKGDVEKITKIANDKLAKREKELSDKIARLEKDLTTNLVDNVANSLAAELSDSPVVLSPHLRNRLRAQEIDGSFKTVVVDQNGQPTDLSVEGLKKEFLANKDFAPILRASKGSGGGAAGRSGSGGAGSGKIDLKADPKTIAAQLKARGDIQE
jgi:hypothetical protein